jgi:AcrR family transcriptional regulator
MAHDSADPTNRKQQRRERRARRRLDDRHETGTETAEGSKADRRAERREALLDAAVDAVRRHGQAVSMEDIAANAGVTKPILYRHFGDRRGLILALGERFSSSLFTELQQALTIHEDPRETVVATIDAFLRFVDDDPEIYKFLVERTVAEQREAAEALDTFIKTVSQQVALVLGEQLRAMGRDSGGAEPLAYGIVGLVYSAGDWWLEHKTMSRQTLVEYLAGLLWGGLDGLGIGQAPQQEDSTR